MAALTGPHLPTRFAGAPPWLARVVLAALAALIVYGALSGFPPGARPEGAGAAATVGAGDLDLYRAIAGRVAAGEPYYDAAVGEHRLRGYPLKPFVTVRLPTLALVLAHLGEVRAAWLLDALVVLTLIALGLRLRAGLPPGSLWLLVLGASALGLMPALFPIFLPLHEVWAAVLIALSLACRAPGRFGLAVLVGLAAVSIRELALPYLAAMAAVAWWEGERREALAWLFAILAFAGGLALHAGLVASHVVPGDIASPGWVGATGWPLILAMVGSFSVLAIAPMPAVALAVPLGLLGWLAWDGPLGRRGSFVVLGYVLAFMVVARANNVYWGALVTPLLLAGLGLAPAALRDLWRAAGPQRSTVTLSPS